jgi:hypothetical protein
VIDSIHFRQMLKERGIPMEWADLVISEPDHMETHEDGTQHYLKQITEYGNRWLRVIVNVDATPQRRVTAFFDRRLRSRA